MLVARGACRVRGVRGVRGFGLSVASGGRGCRCPAPTPAPSYPQVRAGDGACLQLRVEKIKTMGDAYMAAAIPCPTAGHRPERAATLSVFTLSMVMHYIIRSFSLAGQNLQWRIGIHSGSPECRLRVGVRGRDRVTELGSFRSESGCTIG